MNDFIVKLVRATRPKDPTAPDMIKRLVDWGAGPRAGQFLAQAGQAFAAMDGRPSVAIDDIKKAAIPGAAPPRRANFQAQAEGKTSDDIVTELLRIVSEPEPKKYAERKKKLTTKAQRTQRKTEIMSMKSTRPASTNSVA